MMESSSSVDDLLLDVDDEEANAVLAMLLAVLECTEMCFTSAETGATDQCYADQSVSLSDQVAILSCMPSLFITLTNFTIDEFRELSGLVCTVISMTARNTGEQHQNKGVLPNFILSSVF